MGSPLSAGGGDTTKSDDLRAQEWAAARQAISDIDTRLSNLRQYGLGFVAALLSAQGLLTSSSGPVASYVPSDVKLAIIVASLALISAMYISDRGYRTTQRDVAVRAQQIERGLGMSLTGPRGQRASRWTSVSVVSTYTLLAGGAGFLGWVVTSSGGSPGSILPSVDVGVTAAVIASFFALEFAHRREFGVSWSLDRYTCHSGDWVAVTLMNSEYGSHWSLRENIPAWWFEPKDRKVGAKLPLVRSPPPGAAGPTVGPLLDIELKAGQYTTWGWDTSDVEPGSYVLRTSPVLENWRGSPTLITVLVQSMAVTSKDSEPPRPAAMAGAAPPTAPL